jgi:hypothetical protein
MDWTGIICLYFLVTFLMFLIGVNNIERTWLLGSIVLFWPLWLVFLIIRLIIMTFVFLFKFLVGKL